MNDLDEGKEYLLYLIEKLDERATLPRRFRASLEAWKLFASVSSEKRSKLDSDDNSSEYDASSEASTVGSESDGSGDDERLIPMSVDERRTFLEAVRRSGEFSQGKKLSVSETALFLKALSREFKLVSPRHYESLRDVMSNESIGSYITKLVDELENLKPIPRSYLFVLNSWKTRVSEFVEKKGQHDSDEENSGYKASSGSEAGSENSYYGFGDDPSSIPMNEEEKILFLEQVSRTGVFLNDKNLPFEKKFQLLRSLAYELEIDTLGHHEWLQSDEKKKDIRKGRQNYYFYTGALVIGFVVMGLLFRSLRRQ